MSFSPKDDSVIRIGCVSYLNAKPLIYGLEKTPGFEVHLAVPSQLLRGLEAPDPLQRLHIALLPVIDYQRLPGLCIVPSGGICSDGTTLTVRIFSRRPVQKIRTIACDTDSHTSVVLARLVLATHFGVRPEFADRAGNEDQADAQLLIGDKVVCEEPPGYEHQLDLGEAWKAMTGLPFVFAVWTARQETDLRDLPQRLSEARVNGLAAVEELVDRFAVPRGWPRALALKYLTHYLRFSIGARELQAIALFHQMAAQHSLIDIPPRALVMYDHS